QSDHLPSWPADLWYEWAKQVNALCRYIGFEKVNLIGSSGGALAAINAALEYPQLIRAVAADSFAGITANPDMTKQIQAGRAAAKQDQGFRAYLQSVHGEDWEQVLDADTDAILRHSEEIGSYFHHPLTDIQARLLLTGSEEDEMFPRGHYRRLFRMICRETPLAESHIFPRGYHPAMLSNTAAFLELFDQFQSL
ncbi:MAG: alpha/beta hydrolase, partial [Clostridia bacterium]|nr:alpha/beta hydrolase [Clostridia bacterium]